MKCRIQFESGIFYRQKANQLIRLKKRKSHFTQKDKWLFHQLYFLLFQTGDDPIENPLSIFCFKHDSFESFRMIHC